MICRIIQSRAFASLIISYGDLMILVDRIGVYLRATIDVILLQLWHTDIAMGRLSV